MNEKSWTALQRPYEKIIVINIRNDSVDVKELKHFDTSYLGSLRLKMPPPLNAAPGRITNADAVIKNISESYFTDLKHALVLLGEEEDPFWPYEGKLDCTLKMLGILAQMHPAHLIIQTRSPLVVLATSLLKKMRGNVSVVIGLECISDTIHYTYSPELPKPSERVKMLSTLKSFGIPVIAQVAPLPEIENNQLELNVLTDYALACSHFVLPCAFENVGTIPKNAKTVGHRRIEKLVLQSSPPTLLGFRKSPKYALREAA